MEDREVKKQQANEKVQTNHILLEMYKHEKSSIDDIIDQALNYPVGANRWRAYEALKKQAALIVKRFIAYSCASSLDCYHTLTDFIDYLLPESLDEDHTPLARRYIDQNALLFWEAHANQSLESQRVKNILA